MQLQWDLRAGPKHYLGYHESCNSEWCSEVASAHPRNINLDDLPPNLLFEVERAGDRLVNKAHQLIGNKTTNLTECFMSVRAKMNGGKQINRIQSGSFKHRCMTAGLSITLGPTWCTDTWRHLFGMPSLVAQSYAYKHKKSMTVTKPGKILSHTSVHVWRKSIIQHQQSQMKIMGQMPLLQTSPVNKIFMTSVQSSSSSCVLVMQKLLS